MDLFTPVVPESAWHPHFAGMVRRRNTWNESVLADWATGFVDRDNKFVREFQTSFNPCFWELYLHAVLKEFQLPISFATPSPDFTITIPNAFSLEATIASNAADDLPEHARDKAVIPKDLNELNRQAMIRVSNAIIGKHRKYQQNYSKLAPDVNYICALTPIARVHRGEGLEDGVLGADPNGARAKPAKFWPGRRPMSSAAFCTAGFVGLQRPVGRIQRRSLAVWANRAFYRTEGGRSYRLNEGGAAGRATLGLGSLLRPVRGRFARDVHLLERFSDLCGPSVSGSHGGELDGGALVSSPGWPGGDGARTVVRRGASPAPRGGRDFVTLRYAHHVPDDSSSAGFEPFRFFASSSRMLLLLNSMMIE